MTGNSYIWYALKAIYRLQWTFGNWNINMYLYVCLRINQNTIYYQKENCQIRDILRWFFFVRELFKYKIIHLRKLSCVVFNDTLIEKNRKTILIHLKVYNTTNSQLSESKFSLYVDYARSKFRFLKNVAKKSCINNWK